MRVVLSALTVLLLGALAPAASAQSGQLSGTVTDRETGETLIGATVRLDGSSQGAATDIDGNYRIIGVRPGTYTLVVSYVGYATQQLEGVRVNVDLTTTTDVQLTSESSLGEVVVSADANLVRRDLTSSEARITSETIDALPVQEVGDILRTQAGITSGDGGLHIRGGRSKEVAYFVDGVRVTDAYDGSVAVQIENEGIEELQIISGTYNAEYGQANSGIINVVTRDPGTRFEGSFEAFTGTYAVPGDGGDDVIRGINVSDYPTLGGELPYLGVDPYSYLDFNPTQYTNLQGSLGGPIIPNRLGFFGLVRHFRNDGWLYGARNFNIDGTPGDSSLVALNGYEKLSGQGTLKLLLGGGSNLTFTTLASVGTGQDLGGRYLGFRQNPGGIPRFRDEGLTASLGFTHLLTSRAFYTLNASTFYKRFQSRAYETIEEYDNNTFLLDTPETVTYDGPDGQPVTVTVPTGPGRFLRGGVDLGRFERRTRNYSLKGDFTWQALDEHLLKTGLEVRFDDIYLQGYGLIQDAENPDSLVVPDATTNAFQEISGVRPFTFSAYVQDKAEYENFIVNAGLRFDYFDSNGEIPVDPQDPNVFNPQRLINIYNDVNGSGVIETDEIRDDNRTTLESRLARWYTAATPKLQLSPRLGFAYPITESGVVHFSYGYFFQIPTYEYLFQNPGYRVGASSGNYGPYGNADLDPQRTIMYEIGLQQGFGADFLLDVTGFYRDIEDWVSVGFPVEATLPGVSYITYTNLDFSNVRGITASLGKRFNGRFSFDLDYTYQVADGSNSDPNDAITARQGGDAPRLQLIPLNWDQRHTFNASAFVGGGGWGTSLIGRFGSGYPYTPSRPQDGDPIGTLPAVPQNAFRRGTTATVDLYAFRDFNVGGVRPRAFLQVYNLFDARNAGGVYGDTGLPNVTFSGPSLATNDPGYYVRPDFYEEPRRVQLGLQINY
jgi:hypothetical protein